MAPHVVRFPTHRRLFKPLQWLRTLLGGHSFLNIAVLVSCSYSFFSSISQSENSFLGSVNNDSVNTSSYHLNYGNISFTVNVV